MQICVVGGGAGGVEVSMALNHRLKVERQKAGKGDAAKCSVSLFSKGQILPGHTPSARTKFLRLAKVGCPACASAYHMSTLVTSAQSSDFDSVTYGAACAITDTETNKH